MSDREEAIRQAGALETRVSDIFDRNAELEALSDSLRAAYDAVASEADALRAALDLRTRQRDSAVRERDVYKQALIKGSHVFSEALRSGNPPKPAQHDKISVLKTAPLMR